MKADRSSVAQQASAPLEVVSLVSLGQHPVSGRLRRAEQDARALELCLALERQSAPGAVSLSAWHASGSEIAPGSEQDQALRGYLGMGLESLTLVTPDSPGAGPLKAADPLMADDSSLTAADQPVIDVWPLLVTLLKQAAPQLVVCGGQGETGEGSGLLPHLLAESLGWPLVEGIVAIESCDGAHLIALQALPRGQRRRLRVKLPALVSVDSAAPAARQSAFAQARRGELASQPSGELVHDAQAEAFGVAPARKRPKRLKHIKATSARDRFKAAAAKAEGGGGKRLEGVSAEEGAAEILKLLREEGVLR
ncbi:MULTISPECIES: electron transfer flavoprotein subunit beta [unclassified Cobetia]|uniref:electron transfer flavoprotein subunit beta n=1 Tax=unclassified Cobetia TaxID=2609414 RepID=UPI0020977B6B|nr:MULTISPECIES: electron transfer flavoprotein subunit beta [unclassified Cobetia]MCO7232581.1 electron transfer flavoprotein subunit beta [Cobetia sp. Dlab-2-AX]MCO7235855.1 electron transfer flavoprotein subunit beta [Cobetia sp. Dlab-2-U]